MCAAVFSLIHFVISFTRTLLNLKTWQKNNTTVVLISYLRILAWCRWSCCFWHFLRFSGFWFLIWIPRNKKKIVWNKILFHVFNSYMDHKFMLSMTQWMQNPIKLVWFFVLRIQCILFNIFEQTNSQCFAKHQGFEGDVRK